MKKANYSCDCGSVMVNCGGCYIRYHNGYGDGCFEAYVFDSEQEFNQYISNETNINKNDIEFVTSSYFKEAYIMSYDIPNMISHQIMKLENGQFAIYHYNGDVYFVKWEDWKEFEDDEEEEEE